MQKKINFSISSYLRFMKHYFKSKISSIIFMTFLILLSILLNLSGPQIIRYFIDIVESGKHFDLLIAAGGLYVTIIFLTQLIKLFAEYTADKIGWESTNNLREDLMSHCLSLDLTFHNDHTSGELIERIDGDVNNLRSLFSSLFILLFGNLLLIFGIIIVLFIEDWRIGVFFSIFVIVSIFSLLRIRNYAVKFWTKLSKIHAKFYGFLGEYLRGTEDIRPNAGVKYILNKYNMIIKEWIPLQIKTNISSSLLPLTTIFLFGIATVFSFIISFYLLNIGVITLGTVYMIFFYTTIIISPIESIRDQLTQLQIADASIERLKELRSISPKITDGSGNHLSKDALSVTFSNVSFRYSKSKTVLKNIDFHLKKGRSLGIMGKTGSGKTSLIRLLLRFYDPYQGEILLNKKNISHLKLNNLRNRVALVTQDIQLFQSSLRDNLLFYDQSQSIKDRQLLFLLKEVGLEAWYSSLSDGLNTVLGPSGIELSAGEAQLLAFTRVLLTDPGLIILDEPTSRLDPLTEEKIEQLLDRILINRTSIIISHKISTIKRTDDILILNNGEIIEYGEKDSLERDTNSIFYKIINSNQKEGIEWEQLYSYGD